VTEKDSSETRRGGADLILCVVQRGHADKVAKAAVQAGAKGATIFFARGMGARDQLGLLGLAIVPEKETILIVCLQTQTRAIFDAMVEAGHLHTPGMGIALVVPIQESVGVLGVDITAAAAATP
jgi:nitrogen regulatory protein P-II 1